MKIENWKDIVGYEGLYQINKSGAIKSLARRGSKGKVIKSFLHKSSNRSAMYYVVFLCKNSNKTMFYLHRILAMTFIPNPQNKSEVNHINGIKTDNHLENLEWCNRKENIAHAVTNNLVHYGESNPLSKLKEKDVLKIKKMYADGMTKAELSRKFNKSFNAIRAIVTGHTWKQTFHKELKMPEKQEP